MVRFLQSVCLFLIMLFTGIGNNINAQNQVSYTAKDGLAFFKAEDYHSAELVYDYLLQKYPKESKYNFYMGICQLKNRSDLSSAIKRLNYARVKGVSRDVYYYLGRAHQLSYHFEEAQANYNKFIQYASSGDQRVEKTNKYLEECKNANRIASKIYSLSVNEKSKVHKSKILEKYSPAKDVGKLYKNGDFFESGVNAENIMFETERGDVVYFSMASNVEDTMSIFKMERLIDGWSESKSLGTPVNSAYNDAFPFMATDGLTLYFSSDRPGGLGGFDIYKIYYDNETQSFLEPINMGVPFNSPLDDYLFVSDDFNEVAWFVSNRETSGDSVMVYTIQWDGTQVRNMADDVNQINKAAQLEDIGVNEEREGDVSHSLEKSGAKVNKKKGLFSFQIGDTITYTQFNQFINAEAASLFKEGFKLEQEKDSLSSVMRTKRGEYSRVANETDRNEIVNEILNLENQVYSLDDQIEEKYLYARQKELNEIMNQIRSGTYKGVKEEEKVTKALNFEGVFIPEKYAYHTNDEFERYYANTQEMYSSLFSVNDKQILHEADSLYVWANILNLESSRLLENSTKVVTEERLKLSQLIKRNGEEEEEEEPTAQKMIKDSKELKLISTRLYHKSLDKKYPVFYLKLKDISKRLGGEQGEKVMNLAQQGNAHFREARNILREPGGLNLDAYEKAGTMKKTGVQMQEEALDLYLSLLEGGQIQESQGQKQNTVSEEKKVTGHIQKSYAELHKGDEAKEDLVQEKKAEKKEELQQEEPAQENEVGEEVVEEIVRIYRVQIGVFRNEPNAESLKSIPAVYKKKLEGRDLTKYYSGSFKTYEEAQAAVPSIVAAGFSGAFVVLFEDGKQIPLSAK